MFDVILVDSLTDAERDVINSALREFNRQANPAFWAALDDPARSPRQLNIVAREQSENEVVGGLFAETHLSRLKISILSVVKRYWRQGIGSRLVAAAESVAMEHGCKCAFVDTMDYQAPGFYERLGYQIVGRLDNWDSHGHAKLWLKKNLQP